MSSLFSFGPGESWFTGGVGFDQLLGPIADDFGHDVDQEIAEVALATRCLFFDAERSEIAMPPEVAIRIGRRLLHVSGKVQAQMKVELDGVDDPRAQSFLDGLPELDEMIVRRTDEVADDPNSARVDAIPEGFVQSEHAPDGWRSLTETDDDDDGGNADATLEQAVLFISIAKFEELLGASESAESATRTGQWLLASSARLQREFAATDSAELHQQAALLGALDDEIRHAIDRATGGAADAD